MVRPADVTAAVQRLIGLVKYLSKFLQDLSELCEPLRGLPHKKAEWNWTHEQVDAFEKTKEAVSMKRSYLSTSVRVSQLKAKEMHLKMDFTLY